MITTVGLVVLADIITKAYINATMMLHESFPVIDGFFNITYVRNPGSAFGFLAGASPMFRFMFFPFVTSVVIIVMLYYIIKSKVEEPLMTWALSLIISGALGNLIDRVRFGEVIDFIDVYVGSHHWPAFNVADSAISVGAVLLILDIFKQQKVSDTPPSGAGRMS